MRIGAGGFPAAAASMLEGPKAASATGLRADQKRSQGTSGGEDSLELSKEALAEVDKLKARDREVRAHEAAHMSAGGSLVQGGPTYTYQQGPDGRRYAVGGEVQLDASEVPDNPEATVVKAWRLRAAALAPADPSAQDRAVAARASTMAAQASREAARKREEAPRLDTIG